MDKIEENAIEAKVIEKLEGSTPKTGQDLCDLFPNVEPMLLWRICYQSPRILIQNCARYYLRYDVTRDNMLRLSPSILRDFLTFSLIYLRIQSISMVELGTRMSNRFRSISIRKLSSARQALLQLSDPLQKELNNNCVVFLSGDIAYFLAHDTPRRHVSSRSWIKGSDIDIVIVYNRAANLEKMKEVEDELLKIKHLFLFSPDIKEELDFIVKPVSRMISQLKYEDIHEKIATKILYESHFLMGRLDIYDSLIGHLNLTGALEKIEIDFEIALSERKQTIKKILDLSFQDSSMDEEVNSLFFASQERLEFT